MLLADYQAYVDCQQRVSDAYRDQDGLDAHVDPQQRAGRALLVGSLDSRLLPRHLARQPDRRRTKDATDGGTAPAATANGVEQGSRAPLGAVGAVRTASTSACSRTAPR